MKIVLLNPNTSTFVTERMAQVAQAMLGDAAEVVGVTATDGPAIVGTRVENELAARSVLELAAGSALAADAVLLGISTDASLEPLRELLPIPAAGMLQAGLLMATQLGGRIGLVTVGPRMLPLYQERASAYGLRVHGWRALDLPSAYARERDEAALDELANAAAAMARQDGLDAIVFAGAVLAGCRQRVQPRVPVPVVDAIEAAALQAFALARTRPAKARMGSYAALPARQLTGASIPLQQCFGKLPPSAG